MPPRSRDRVPSSALRGKRRGGGGDWDEQVADSLDRFAGELPSDCQCADGLLYDEFVLLFVELGIAALLDATKGSRRLLPTDAELESSGDVAWAGLLVTAEQLNADWLDRPCGGPSELQRHRFSLPTLCHLLGWLRSMARQAEIDADGAARELGTLHESLLGLRLERLPTPARRLRKSRAWLRPMEVLGWAPDVRAKRLQRELGLSSHHLEALGPALALASTPRELEDCLAGSFEPRVEPRDTGRWVVQPSSHRRQSGAHYTPWAMCRELVERCLAPVVSALPQPRSSALLELRVCDPAMGAGAFLVAATRYLADALVQAWRDETASSEAKPEVLGMSGADPLTLARAMVARSVLMGVDKNPLAVDLSRLTLRLFAFPNGGSSPHLREHLRQGDALIGEGALDAAPFGEASEAPRQPRAAESTRVSSRTGALHWRVAFPEVFGRDNPGFDAVIGNPPWVAYVGRAAQPLEPALSAHYAATNPAFKRYRTLHGLFVYRSAALLRHGGRLGLILPTSVADLEGYQATRAAHDGLCDVDAALPDWGDGAFAGVFQPSMALLSTRRDGPPRARSSGVWALTCNELGERESGLLERLRRLPPFPRESFGERGFQTTRDDQAYLRRSEHALTPFTVPLRGGADIGECRALAPHLFADPERLGTRLRPAAEWQKVSLLIRQTARFPIAACADGAAFRNSILAGFASAEWPAALLLCFLNSSLARWLHYSLHRDARQGMPQLKIGHLRALPALPGDLPRARDELIRLGQRLAARNDGVEAAERAQLDELVNDAFGLRGAERDIVLGWASTHQPPISRRFVARPVGLPAPASAPPPRLVEELQ